MSEPTDAFGAHILSGTLGTIGDREIGLGHVVLSEERYEWLLARARAFEGLERRAREAERALLSLTADGSEFYRRSPDRSSPQEFVADVSACLASIRDARERMRERLMRATASRARSA